MDISADQLPTKIKDGCLLDTMVNLHFQTEYNQEVIENTVEEKLNTINEGNNYSKVPVIEKGEVLPDRTFFANDIYRIMVVKDTLSFNIVKSYPTWIKRCLRFVEQMRVLKQRSRMRAQPDRIVERKRS